MKRTYIARGRIVVAGLLMGLFWAVATLRLVQVQLFEHARASDLADRQARGWVNIPAERGMIFDRNGTLLAANETRTSFAAVPRQWTSRKARLRAADRIIGVAGGTRDGWLERFDASPQFIYIQRQADARTAARIRAWKDEAVFELQEPGRRYPQGDVARELLGAVDVDNRGCSGIEQALDSVLADEPGKGQVRFDATRQFYIDPLPAALARDGSNVYLTIDLRWQEIVEQELHQVVRSTKSLGGGAIFMTPRGEIYALAYFANDSITRPSGRPYPRCRPVTDLFEPGSTFKSFISAALLSEGLVTLTDSVYADSGLSRFGDRLIRDSKPHGWLNFVQSLEFSSNIAFGKWAQRFDGSELYKWTHDFGFGTVTGLGLSAEPAGIIPNPERWTVLAKAQLAMGHSIAATPLQVVTGFSAFANGGGLYRPFIVAEIVDPAGDTVMAGKPLKTRHLIRASVVETMGKLLIGVVAEGTAKHAQSKAITLAGKTGTAQKVAPEGGYYRNGKYIASFVGYFPADQPQVVGIVYLDEPQGQNEGGVTAAPAFRDIAERLAAMNPELLDYPVLAETSRLPDPREDPEPEPGFVPDLVGLPLARATAVLTELGYQAMVEGSGCVQRQSPDAGVRLAAGGTVHLEAGLEIAQLADDAGGRP
jgi:cell division protein FtsI (penicillin-binding protein 3)